MDAFKAHLSLAQGSCLGIQDAAQVMIDDNPGIEPLREELNSRRSKTLQEKQKLERKIATIQNAIQKATARQDDIKDWLKILAHK